MSWGLEGHMVDLKRDQISTILSFDYFNHMITLTTKIMDPLPYGLTPFMDDPLVKN